MFQLYHTLNSNIQSTDLKKIEKTEILKTIDTMDQSSKEALFLLIYEHYRLNEDPSDIYKLPYGGTEKNNGIEFNLSKMPIKLRRIIYKFIKIVQTN